MGRYFRCSPARHPFLAFEAAAEAAARIIEQLPESQLWETFADEKYGNYYRNLHGAIEYAHYHLGQIVLVKKLLA